MSVDEKDLYTKSSQSSAQSSIELIFTTWPWTRMMLHPPCGLTSPARFGTLWMEQTCLWNQIIMPRRPG